MAKSIRAALLGALASGVIASLSAWTPAVGVTIYRSSGKIISSIKPLRHTETILECAKKDMLLRLAQEWPVST